MRALKQRLAALQTGRPWALLLAGLAVAALSLPSVRSLPLQSDWAELLPRDAPSVRDLRTGEGRVGGLTTLTLVVESHDLPAMQRFSRDLVARLERLPPADRVRRIEWNVSAYQSFVRARRALYAPLAELHSLRDALDARVAWGQRRANPMFVDLDDPPPDPMVTLDQMRARGERAASRGFSEGFFARPGGAMLVVFLRTDITGGDATTARRLMNDVSAEIARLAPSRYAADLRVEFAGDLPVATEEHDAIARELVTATALTLALCALVVYGLFRRARAIAQLGVALGVPVLVTFALAKLTVGHLNTSTAFLGSIVVGNGVNPGIVWLARYFEARRAGEPVQQAILTSHTTTWPGTLAASLAASLAYGSLVITGFRGFRDFGLIGGAGMVICWAFTMLLLPAVVAAWERRRPLSFEGSRAHENPYGAVFSRVMPVAPRAMLAASLGLALVGVGVGAAAIARDPLEYDFRRLTSAREATARASLLNGRVGEIVGRTGSGNAIAVLARTREDVPRLRAALEEARDRHGAPYGPVRSIDDLLPRDQPQKLALLADIRRLLNEARPVASPADRARIDDAVRETELTAVTDGQLPEAVAALYTERDGTRGRLLFVEEKPGASTWDGRYLVAWSRAIRAAVQSHGEGALVVGRAPIFADMISAIGRDGPRAVMASFAATVALVLFAFGRWRDRALTLGALLVGIAWMALALTALRLRLNFLNFVALPITFGIGADYAVNVARRYADERAGDGAAKESLHRAVVETGGAIVVCSFTTVFGYGALLTSANRALNSFGLAAVLGEVCCLLAAMLALPAALMVRDQRIERSSRHGTHTP